MLQSGDPSGQFVRALEHFPFPHIAQKVLDAFLPKNRQSRATKFRNTPVFTIKPSELLISLTICANFVAVWLAKEGHDRPISINYLEKLALSHLYAITGAMLAGVDVITMGAGIPKEIPAVLENIARGRIAQYRVPVNGRTITDYIMEFNPREFFQEKFPELKKPDFIPIISSNTLADIFMTKLPANSVQGFVIEQPTAGGHNAPPRKLILNANREPIYGPRDIVDFRKIADHGLPFWIGGSCASPDKLAWAKSVGATGIQAGSIFALCQESDLRAIYKNKIKQLGYSGDLTIKTDFQISPTGFPFKVAQLDNTIADVLVYTHRPRICDQGALRVLYEKPDGTIGYRCAAEPIADFLRKGGNVDDAIGCGCLCNALLATAGLLPDSSPEAPIITLGEDLSFLRHLMADANSSYTAEQAINYLLS